MMRAYVPLSVREGGRRAKVGWWLKGRREGLALRLAPWLGGRSQALADARRALDEVGR